MKTLRKDIRMPRWMKKEAPNQGKSYLDYLEENYGKRKAHILLKGIKK